MSCSPLALRVITGTICGAGVCGSRAKRSLADGAILGGGAMAGALMGYQVRKRLRRSMPDFVALLEDAVAVGGSALVVTLARPAA